MIGHSLGTMPIAAHKPPPATAGTDDFRRIAVLCRFAVQTVCAARHAPVRHINAGALLSFVTQTVFNAAALPVALWQKTRTHAAIFQPEEV